MGLREPVSERLALASIVGVVAGFGILALLVPSRLMVPICAVICGMFAAFLLLRAWFIAYLRRAFVQAVRAEDPTKARSISERLLKVSRLPAWRSQWTMANGSLLALEERYAESRAILEAIDREHLSALGKVALDNDIAWALAHDGAPAEAVAFAERAIAALPKESPAELSSSCVGTLGVTQLKAGHAAEARETLERALGLGGTPRAIATRAFYLGEALVALGHHDDAAAAYERAVRTTPAGLYGKKARAALDALGSKLPYRG